MNNSTKNECNGPIQMSDVIVTENHKSKCAEIKNGYLKNADGVPDTADPLLGATTVVQLSENGPRTSLVPKKSKNSRERCLLMTVLALVVLSGVCLLLLVNGRSNYGCITQGESYLIGEMRIRVSHET